MNPEKPQLDPDLDSYPPPPKVKRHSSAHAARRNAKELGVDPTHASLDESWTLDDFTDLLPDRH